MKLSSTEIVTAYRMKLKALRHARQSCKPGGGNSINCKTWYHGEEINFSSLVGIGNLSASLAALLDNEIEQVLRGLEAHGVVVDE